MEVEKRVKKRKKSDDQPARVWRCDLCRSKNTAIARAMSFPDKQTVLDFLKANPKYIGKIDTIILDPPRAGIAPKTLKKIIELGANKLVYISCNPSTQARDASILFDAGFELIHYCLVDQFPHTGHIESIAKFKKI